MRIRALLFALPVLAAVLVPASPAHAITTIKTPCNPITEVAANPDSIYHGSVGACTRWIRPASAGGQRREGTWYEFTTESLIPGMGLCTMTLRGWDDHWAYSTESPYSWTHFLVSGPKHYHVAAFGYSGQCTLNDVLNWPTTWGGHQV